MSNAATKVIKTLSVWGIIMLFLTWLAKQLLEYLMIIITPWLNWLISWAVLVGGIVLVLGIITTLSVGYLAYRSWTKRREEKSDVKADAKA